VADDLRTDELLIAILGALEALPARIADAIAARSARASKVGAADRRAMELVPAIAEAVGSLRFTAAALLAQRSADPDLAGALERALGPPNARKLGRLLARAGGTLIGEFAVERVGASRDGALWRIVRVSKLADSRERLPAAVASVHD